MNMPSSGFMNTRVKTEDLEKWEHLNILDTVNMTPSSRPGI